MEFTRRYFVHYYEADSSRRLTIPALVQYFEDIAILHSASCGFDLDYYAANHCVWMLLKWDIQIHELPSFGQTVTVTTRVHAMKRFQADREFVLRDESGTILVEGRSNWLYADTIRRRPVRIPEDQYSKFGVSPEGEASFISIEDPEPMDIAAASPVSSIRTVNSDIDTNAHVNNVRYIAWALDSLPADYAANRTPESVRVSYKKELTLGEEAAVVIGLNGEGRTRHAVAREGEILCSLELKWKARP